MLPPCFVSLQVPPVPSLEAKLAEKQVDDQLTVSYQFAEHDVATGLSVFRGNVTARFGFTVVECEELHINTLTRTGRVVGRATLTDPEGWMVGDDLEFDWGARTGSARQAEIKIGNVRMKVSHIDIAPGVWNLSDARATISQNKNPEFWLTSEHVTIYPGRRGIARKAGLEVFGLGLGPIPSTSFNLDPRVTGFKWPGIAERRGRGFGVTWDSSIALDDQTGLTGFASSFPRQAPEYGLSITRSWVDPERSLVPLRASSDLGERFSEGWFENIGQASPGREKERIRGERRELSLGTYWNQRTVGRVEDSFDVSKPLELAGAWGGSVGDWGGFVDLRAQGIRPTAGAPTTNRLGYQATVVSPDWMITPDLRATLRLDTAGFWSQNGHFGFARGQASLLAQPLDGVTVGVAYGHASEFGQPDFAFDRLHARRTFHARADYVVGPTTLRYLVRYDADQGRWFDHQYEFAWVAGSFEPFIVGRRFPSDFRIGIRFRLGNFQERVQQRTARREGP